MKFHSSVTARERKLKGEATGNDYNVKPNQALTPREILTRFATSREIPQLNPSYNIDSSIPDLTYMDEFEKIEYSRNLQKKVEKLRQQTKDLQDEMNNEKKYLIELMKQSQKDPNIEESNPS